MTWLLQPVKQPSVRPSVSNRGLTAKDDMLARHRCKRIPSPSLWYQFIASKVMSIIPATNTSISRSKQGYRTSQPGNTLRYSGRKVTKAYNSRPAQRQSLSLF